jgi:predicted MFS family arabinose efflux permease
VTRTIGRISFPIVLATVMGAGTFSLVVFAVHASNLIEEFGAQRWQIGTLVTATTLIGAGISPAVGGATDRIGARNATLITLFVSATGLAGIALSPAFAVLVVAALIGGVGSLLALRIIAVLSAVAASLLIASTVVAPLVWLAAVVTGLSASSWNAVGMLAVISTLPTSSAGRGSGVVLLGFLFGLAVGAPAFGYSVDRLGSYIPGWIGIGVVFLAALLATRVERPVAETPAV